MSCLLLEVGGVGRQLKYSRMGRRDSVGSTSTLRLGCFGRTQAMVAGYQEEWRELAVVLILD